MEPLGLRVGRINLHMEAILGEQQDITSAKETYVGFMSMLKWGTIAAAIATILIVLIIASRAA